MTKLNQVPVRFDQEAHTYTDERTGKLLKGITGTLVHRVFPDKYKDIPKHILANAAARGSNVHEDIELAEELEVTPTTQEGLNYLELKKAHGLNFLESEYTVSDLEHYASQIDILFEAGENLVDLADIKTTSKFDRESVSWQLSIYAYFFELNNPHAKVRKLYGIWLRGEIAELIEVDRHTEAEVKALIQADIEDKPFDYSPAFPDFITENEESLIALGKTIKRLQEEYDGIKSNLFEKMQESGEGSIDTGKVLYTITKASTRSTFNSKAFKKDHADMYEQYISTTQISENIKITIR